MFSLALSIEGQSVGTARQGSTALSVCSALKAQVQLLQGIQVTLHMLNVTAITVSLGFGVSLSHSFPYSAHPQVGLERGPHGKPSWGKEKDLSHGAGVLGSFCGALRLCSMSYSSVPTWLPPLRFPSPDRAETCRCCHVTHDAAG